MTQDVVVKKLSTKDVNSAFSIGLGTDQAYLKINWADFWTKGIIIRKINFKNFFSPCPLEKKTV